MTLTVREISRKMKRMMEVSYYRREIGDYDLRGYGYDKFSKLSQKEFKILWDEASGEDRFEYTQLKEKLKKFVPVVTDWSVE